MNRSELKKVLKPLIKECIKEVLLEETGVLSKVVTEVARGITTTPAQTPMVEQKTREIDYENERRKEIEAQNRNKQAREQMLKAIGENAYNGVDLFEGTTPMTSGGGSSEKASPMGPMKDIDPNDPGVDLNSIPGLNISVARKLAGG